MSRPSPPQAERARLLLEHEGAAGSAEKCATAAGRVYEKLHTHLAPLLGVAGVQALFARSARLTQGEFAFLEVASVESATGLRVCLQVQDSAVAMESAATLIGTFFSLITTFIGERLTTEALRSAWPTIEELGPLEKLK